MCLAVAIAVLLANRVQAEGLKGAQAVPGSLQPSHGRVVEPSVELCASSPGAGHPQQVEVALTYTALHGWPDALGGWLVRQCCS